MYPSRSNARRARAKAFEVSKRTERAGGNGGRRDWRKERMRGSKRSTLLRRGGGFRVKGIIFRGRGEKEGRNKCALAGLPNIFPLPPYADQDCKCAGGRPIRIFRKNNNPFAEGSNNISVRENVDMGDF